MEGTTEKDCSPLWNLYQQIVSDMKVGHVFLIVCGSLYVYAVRVFISVWDRSAGHDFAMKSSR